MLKWVCKFEGAYAKTPTGLRDLHPALLPSPIGNVLCRREEWQRRQQRHFTIQRLEIGGKSYRLPIPTGRLDSLQTRRNLARAVELSVVWLARKPDCIGCLWRRRFAH